jgi:type VI secretion system protein ImpG
MALAEATITEMVSGFTGIASVRNLTEPTLPLYPPRHHPEYDWRVLGHFTTGGANELNTIQMGGAPALREVLELYDWAACDAIERRINAIKAVWLAEHQTVGQASGPRVVRLYVHLDATAFDGPGDTALFGDVLSRFVGRYACFHHAMQLVLSIDGKETVYPRWNYKGAPF